MNDKEREELRYDVASHLLNRMSKGSLFQYAHMQMMQLIDHLSEQELLDVLPQKKRKRNTGQGF